MENQPLTIAKGQWIKLTLQQSQSLIKSVLKQHQNLLQISNVSVNLEQLLA